MASTSINSIRENPARGSEFGLTPYITHLNYQEASVWQRVSRSQIIDLSR